MRIVLTDDSALMPERPGGYVSLYNQVEIVALFDNGTKVLKNIQHLKHYPAIIDLQMSGLKGLEVSKAIRKEEKKVKNIILPLFSSSYYQKIIRHFQLNKAHRRTSLMINYMYSEITPV
jgi:DNA-binding NarL/FixJ family response regulator